VPGLRHGLARRHGQPGIQPEHGRPVGGLPGRLRVVEVRSRHLQPGEVSGPLIDGHGRVDADLGRPLVHRDPRQRARPVPGRAARPPDDLPDARVLPGPGRRRPLPAGVGDPGVAQEPQHRARRALQRVRPGRRRRPVNPDDKRQRVLPPLVPGGVLHPRGRPAGRPLFVAHESKHLKGRPPARGASPAWATPGRPRRPAPRAARPGPAARRRSRWRSPGSGEAQRRDGAGSSQAARP
jgi:hypothetical protein